MSVLLQISDTHFGTEQPPVVEALAQLSRELQPAVLVVSGDVTQRARHGQFTAARQFVDRLAVPAVVAIPGNHDIPLFNLFARIFHPYSGFERVFGSNLEPQWQSDDFLIIGVNTTRPSRHKDGEISATQVERVARRLQAATVDQLRIVVTHQPVHVLREGEFHNRVHGFEPAIHAWSAAGADLVLGGHIHLPFIAALNGRYPDLQRRSWAVQAGTALSYRTRANHPNSVNAIRYSQAAAECVIEQWTYKQARQRFECVITEHLPLDRAIPA